MDLYLISIPVPLPSPSPPPPHTSQKSREVVTSNILKVGVKFGVLVPKERDIEVREMEPLQALASTSTC